MGMFVKSMMIPKFGCFTVQQDENLGKVLEKLEKHGIDGVPVLNDATYIGAVTRDAIYKHFF
jgi:CBS domain-containing protein